MARRVIVLGGPRTGKSTLGERLQSELSIPTLHTSLELEDLFPVDQPESWSRQSEHASKWFDDPGDWICEGVQMARALRKWLKANPDKPLDADVVLLRQPMVPQRDGQKAMMKGVETVFKEIQGELEKRGARIAKLKSPDDAIDMFRSAVPIDSDSDSDAEAVPVALKRKLTKEEFDKLSDAHKELYKDPGNNGNYVLDAEPDEETEPLKTALEREKAAAAAAKKTADDLAAKYKDTDPEEYKRLKAAADEAAREGKKTEGDWEGWKKTFIDEEARKLAAKDEEITGLKTRVQTFLLDNKISQAALESGVRKKLLPHVVTNTKQHFRLDQSENIEVLDEHGNPINVSIEAFFKDKYSTEFPEYYEPTGNGGSGASNNGSGSRGGARVISSTDQAGMNGNLADIASGKVIVQ
jgi:hypothetical protein